MCGGDAVMIFLIRVETAGEHCFEDRRVSTLGRHVHHEMMLGAKLTAQIGMSLQHCVGSREVATSADCADYTNKIREIHAICGRSPRLPI